MPLEKKKKEIVVEDNTSLSQEIHEQNKDADQLEDKPKELLRSWRFVKHHPQNQILGDPSQRVKTIRNINAYCENHAFISQVEPKTIEEVLKDEKWISTTQKELN